MNPCRFTDLGPDPNQFYYSYNPCISFYGDPCYDQIYVSSVTCCMDVCVGQFQNSLCLLTQTHNTNETQMSLLRTQCHCIIVANLKNFMHDCRSARIQEMAQDKAIPLLRMDQSRCGQMMMELSTFIILDQRAGWTQHYNDSFSHKALNLMILQRDKSKSALRYDNKGSRYINRWGQCNTS